MRISMTILLVIASFMGCTVEGGEGLFEAQEVADVGQSPDVSIGADTSLGGGNGAGVADGTWMLVHQASTCVLIEEQLTWAYYLVDISSDDRVLTEERRECDVILSPILGLRPVIPRAALDSIVFHPVDSGYVTGVRVGDSYTSSTELGLWGVELGDPVRDSVPTEASDPRVVDSDGDGNPGVTFATEGSDCDRYVAHRQLVRYFGTFTAPNQIDGRSVNVTDSNVLGSSRALCGTQARVGANDAHSNFRMVRVDGAGGSPNLDADGDGEVSCEEARPFFPDALETRDADAERCD